ncbi:MAG: hypothetical protein K9G62_03895 [Alphaproteobacteria bacterium]|nr:hypothetical protein [Alphaproteobacteria bacterium]
MMNLLHDPTIWLVFSFVIFVGILWIKGKTAFLNLIDSRIESIRREIETAENLRAEAQKLLEEYETRHRNAVKDAKAIVTEATKHAAAIHENAKTELEDLIQRREAQLASRLQRMENEAMAEIKSYAATLAVQATAGLIAERLGKEGHSALIDSAIASAPGNLA